MAGPKPVGKHPISTITQLAQDNPNLRRIMDPEQQPCSLDVERCVAVHWRREHAKWERNIPRSGEGESARVRTAPVVLAKTLVSVTYGSASVTDVYSDGAQQRTPQAPDSDARVQAALSALHFGNDYIAKSGRGFADGRLEFVVGPQEIDPAASSWFTGAQHVVVSARDCDGDLLHDLVIVAVRRGAEVLIVDFKANDTTVSSTQ